MDESFLGNAGAALSYNPCDNRCKDLISEYKKAEKLIISPSSSLLREQLKAKEYQHKLEYIKKETEERYVSQLHKMQSENKKLQKDTAARATTVSLRMSTCISRTLGPRGKWFPAGW
jgi:hypothetical protein